MMTYQLANYRGVAGHFKHSSALAGLLRHAGCVAPHTGEAWSEAMLLGIGGGLGAGYILWEFKAHHSAVLTLGFHHRWNYTKEWYEQTLERVGAVGTWMETGGARRAAKALDAALRNGHPALCWVDEFHLPYMHVSEAFEGCFGWVVTVFGLDQHHVRLDDVWGPALKVDRACFEHARARIGSYKNRQLTVVSGQGCIDLRASVRAGIDAHIAYLGGKSTSFGLGAVRKWSRTLTDTRGAKGWPQVFADGTRLASVFCSMREGIALRGMDGAGLRALYADFLREAGGALTEPALVAAATTYDNLAARWRQLSSAPFALPSKPGDFSEEQGPHPFAHVDDLRRLHAVLDTKFAALSAGDVAAAAGASAEVARLTVSLDTQPQWTTEQQQALFQRLAEQIQALWFAEKQAIAELRAWISK